MNIRVVIALLIAPVITLTAALPAHAARPKIQLVLQITVDQLRGDFVERFGDRFGKDGFRYFLDDGAYYANAHYTHANTETAPGHATLATGATPSRHGIVANDWIDVNTGAFVYNTEDARHRILGEDSGPHAGVSPRNLKSSTFGDELVMFNAGRSRVFSVSIKDRGAILPGGHAGKAFWFSRRQGTFVTSTYYYDEYPAWVADWQSKRLANEYKGQEWELVLEPSGYVAHNIDDRPYEVAFDGLGRTFPHELGSGQSKYFYTKLSVTPMGDELTLKFAKALIEAEELGQRDEVDYLQISFSSPDYAGHLFGASSLEYEDAVLRLDGVLEELFRHVNKQVGLYRTLIVLSADHGGVEAPEYAAATGLETGRFPLDWFRSGNPLAEQLTERFGRDDLIAAHSHPYLYLNRAAIEDAQLDRTEVERFVAAELTRLPGIRLALGRSDIVAGSRSSMPIPAMIERGFDPARSGDVHLVQDQYWFLHSSDEPEKMGIESSLAAIHGSPWRYDSFVPILFAGPGITRRTVNRRVGPQDIAPTLSAWFGVKPPSGSVGEPLVEVLP